MIKKLRISVIRHNCGNNQFPRALQTFVMRGSDTLVDQCPLYWKMKGGDTYWGNIHYITFLGIRIVISTIKKKSLWIK